MNTDKLIEEIAEAFLACGIGDDEITARMVANKNENISQRVALYRLTTLAERGLLKVRKNVGSNHENAFSPSDGHTWEEIIPLINK
jgi:hypothetical protein